MEIKLKTTPHKRFNALNGEWILVSPHRSKRPWQGKQENSSELSGIKYDKTCYLCPGNSRSEGEVNPVYSNTFAFNNDFSALLPDEESDEQSKGENHHPLFKSENVRGICRVICFSPRHDLTLARMNHNAIVDVIELWKKEFSSISENTWIKSIQIFENKGEIMGCSNPHPHGQIWAQSDLPNEIIKENKQQEQYFSSEGKSLLSDYLEYELEQETRIICTNEHFVALIPFWATWPFETLIICRRHIQTILQFTHEETNGLAEIIKRLTIRYDNLFKTSFPYSAGMHQAPVNSNGQPHWHWHMHFYPPLLRSASIKKFMVGYELLAGPQRDITPEIAASTLKNLSEIHYLDE